MQAAIIDSLHCIDLIDQKIDRNETLTYFQELSDHHDSEIKLYTSDLKNYIASFSWKGINQWKVDCPEELHKFHSQRYATTEECIFFIKKLFEVGHLENQKGFIDVPVNHFTLDDMIAFKEEDKMMLKGQDPNAKKSNALNPKQTATEKPALPQKKSPSKPLQQMATKVSKEISPNPLKSLTETITKKGLKPSGDSSLFSI